MPERDSIRFVEGLQFQNTLIGLVYRLKSKPLNHGSGSFFHTFPVPHRDVPLMALAGGAIMTVE